MLSFARYDLHNITKICKRCKRVAERNNIMATSKDFLTFILEQLSEIDNITYRQMMGEYIIYQNGKIAAYLCDNRLLVKTVPSAEAMLPGASHEPPYDGAKDMILVEQIEDKQFLTRLFNAIYDELPSPVKKKEVRADKRNESEKYKKSRSV